MLEKVVTYSRLLIEDVEQHPGTWPKLTKSNKKKKKEKKRKKEKTNKDRKQQGGTGALVKGSELNDFDVNLS